MGKLLKIIMTALLSIIVVIILVFGINTFFTKPADIDIQDYRVDLSRLEPSSDYGLLLAEAEEMRQANEELAESAPQQTVVGLWNLADIQSIIVLENQELLNQNHELAKQNDSIIIQNNTVIKQNETLLNNQAQTKTLLILFLVSILILGTSIILLMIWKTKKS